MDRVKICVSTAFGVEAITKRELEGLGISDLKAENGKIVFEGDLRDVVRCNLLLRTANKVFVVLGTFPAHTFDEAFEAVAALPLEEYLPKDAAFPVTGKTARSELFAYSALQSVIKKAVCTRLMRAYRTESLPESGARYALEFYLYKNECMLCLNTSGEGLHRRGYRTLVGEAPLKETLAAAILQLSFWNPDKLLVDPFCGSGTIPVEAALMSRNIAPGKHRAFDFALWGEEYSALLKEEKALAEARELPASEVRIQGYDIEESQISLARAHARAAGVEDSVHLQRRDMRDLSSHEKYGVIVTNPPYGKRLGTDREIALLMKDYGRVFARLPDWSAYTLTSFPDFERCFGKKADKKRKLFNGNLECVLYLSAGKPPQKKA